MKQAKAQLRRKCKQIQEALVSGKNSCTCIHVVSVLLCMNIITYMYTYTYIICTVYSLFHIKELDLKILEDLAEKEKEEEALATARREKEQFDAIWMKKVMEEQLALEKERELQLDLIYQYVNEGLYLLTYRTFHTDVQHLSYKPSGASEATSMA